MNIQQYHEQVTKFDEAFFNIKKAIKEKLGDESLLITDHYTRDYPYFSLCRNVNGELSQSHGFYVLDNGEIEIELNEQCDISEAVLRQVATEVAQANLSI